MDNEIKLFFCNLCHLTYKIVKWEKKYSKFGFICHKCKTKIDKRLLQINMGF